MPRLRGKRSLIVLVPQSALEPGEQSETALRPAACESFNPQTNTEDHPVHLGSFLGSLLVEATGKITEFSRESIPRNDARTHFVCHQNHFGPSLHCRIQEVFRF